MQKLDCWRRNREEEKQYVLWEDNVANPKFSVHAFSKICHLVYVCSCYAFRDIMAVSSIICDHWQISEVSTWHRWHQHSGQSSSQPLWSSIIELPVHHPNIFEVTTMVADLNCMLSQQNSMPVALDQLDSFPGWPRDYLKCGIINLLTNFSGFRERPQSKLMTCNN